MFKKGDVIKGPNDSGYIMQRDRNVGDVIDITDVLPFGGAPKPAAGEAIPDWFADAVIRRPVKESQPHTDIFQK